MRFAIDWERGEEVKQRKFAQDIMNLSSDKMLIFDAFGDAGSKGASIDFLPSYAEEIYIGPSILEEFTILENVLLNGYNSLIFGGEKLDKIQFLQKLIEIMKPGGFVLVGSGPSYAFEHEYRSWLSEINNEEEKMVTAVDYRHPEITPPFDIGDGTIEKFIKKLDSLNDGDSVLYNGTMGIMEDDYESLIKNFSEENAKLISSGIFQKGTEAIVEKLKELTRRGVKIIIIGGDAGMAAKKYSLKKEENVIEFSGGGVPIKVYAGELLRGLRAIHERLGEI